MSIPSTPDSSFVIINESNSPTSSTYVSDKPEQTPHPSCKDDYIPGSIQSYAHNWSQCGTGGELRTHGRHFIDAYGRVCILRGVNISGSCKIPMNHDPVNFPENHESVTFVGRPFPLEEAHEHFSRLRRWGFTFLRILVTWEAIEHEGPGIYDEHYVNYLRSLLSLLPRYGIVAFISMHQDVWSRYSGGSGAPAWTLKAVGFDLKMLEETGAAWLNGMRGGGHEEVERGVWPSGYQKLAAATMATCFWAGNIFTPNLKVDGVPVQDFLQIHYINAYEFLMSALEGLEGIMGIEMMNEPHRGYIDMPSLHSFDYNTDLHLSHIPSAFQSFQLGAGYPAFVPTYTRSFPLPTRKTSHTLLNKNCQKVWLDDGPTQGRCIWEMHDVWRWDTSKNQAVVLRENYFINHPITGKKIDWYIDFYYPFLRKWNDHIQRSSRRNKMNFVEPIPNEFCPESWTEEHRLPNMVYAPHWYDLNALFSKAFGDFTVNVQGLSRGMFPLKAFYWGHKGARNNFLLQIRNLAEHAYRSLGEIPVIIGECGIPMDMNRAEAFKTDDFTWHMKMMDALMTGLEKSLIGFTLWNYNPLNDDIKGDDWNGENFSWFSRKRALPPSLLYYEQDAVSLDSGGRILQAVVRPYPAKTAGIPLKFEYEMNTGVFTYSWAIPNSAVAPNISSFNVHTPPLNRHQDVMAQETEIYLPTQITQGRKVIVDGLGAGNAYRYDPARQTLFIVTRDGAPGKVYKVHVAVDPPLKPLFEVNSFWSDFGLHILSFMTVIIGIILYRFFVFLYPGQA